MLKTEKMKFINLYIHEDAKDEIVDMIIKSGMVHLTESDIVNKFLKEEQGIYHYKDNIDISKAKSKTYDLINMLNIEPDWNIDDLDLDKEIVFKSEDEIIKLDNIIFEISKIKNMIKEKNNIINKYHQMLKQISVLKESGYSTAQKIKFEYLNMRLGKVDQDVYQKLEKEFGNMIVAVFPVQSDNNQIFLYVITIKRNQFKVNEILDKYGFEDIDLSEGVADISDDFINGIKNKISTEINEKNDLVNDIEDKRKEYIDYIKNLFLKLKIAELKIKVNKYFLKTSNIFMISGWLPENQKQKFINLLKNELKKKYFLEIYSAKELKELENVPVFFKTPKIFSPFEALTFNYGTPQYKTINPIPFVAISYLLMFGFMFGDVGHGFVLVLLGAILGSLKKFASSKPIMKLLVYCGISSMGFGVFFGSVFGYEHIIEKFGLKPYHPIEHLNALFGIAIGFGIILITIGILINIINSFITKDYIKGIFSKSGLIGGIMYWGMIIIVSKMFVLKETVEDSIYVIFILIPVIILFLKEPLLKFFKKQKRFFKEGFGVYFMENVVELMEIGISYVSNTMSFIRIVAFGLAHAGLFIAIFSLIDVLKKAGSPCIINILILILGNIGIIFLEGLVVSIQAMRLEYYEFFGKFFDKTGVKYDPIKI